MAGKENLRPPKSTEEARERGRKGGKRSGEVKRERKALKEELIMLLSEGDTQQSISVALISKAMDGDVRAFETIRDTIGEKPTNKQDVALGGCINGVIKVELVDDLAEWAK